MQIKQNPFYSLSLIPILLLLVFVVSCGSKDKFTGVYKAEGKDLPKQVETLVELKSNGDGTWKVGDEEVPFSWYIKDGELRINTKGGGVIVGDLEGNTIHLTIPGNKKMIFRKTR